MKTEIEILNDVIGYAFKITWTNEFHTYKYVSPFVFENGESAYDGALIEISNK